MTIPRNGNATAEHWNKCTDEDTVACSMLQHAGDHKRHNGSTDVAHSVITCPRMGQGGVEEEGLPDQRCDCRVATLQPPHIEAVHEPKTCAMKEY